LHIGRAGYTPQNMSMEIIRSGEDIPDAATGTVLAVGNFDGVHRGHQALIGAARDIAKKEKRRLGVLTFEPHPRNLFRPDDPPFRITPFEVKARRLEECGVEVAFCLTFDWDFASQSAEVFTDTVLGNSIRPARVVAGADFCFGQLRKGTPETLKQAGLAVTVIDKTGDEDGETYSSSAIRAALRQGDIAKANAMLGWEWEMEGAIVKGDQRGRGLGFPTANVHPGETIHPAYGVYATWVNIEGEKEWRQAATNIGIRPMFEVPVGQVEAHILDFDRDIYGNTLRVKPVKRLRGEARFESLEALVAQIGRDCEEARAVLK